MNTPIQIWCFEDAPAKYRMLSNHGGDEDWLALIPASMVNEYFDWMDEGTSFGCARVSKHTLQNGKQVRIGAHA